MGTIYRGIDVLEISFPHSGNVIITDSTIYTRSKRSCFSAASYRSSTRRQTVMRNIRSVCQASNVQGIYIPW